jgi:hypothetical protein
VLVVGFYFRNFVPNTVSYYEPADSLGLGLVRASNVLAIALGMGGGESLWTFSGPTVATLLLMSAVLLVAILWNQRSERARALGLLLFVGFVACYALVIGWERPLCLGYYGTYPALGLCCVYYVWGLYASARVGSFVQAFLVALVCAIFPLNTHFGLEYGSDKHQEMEPLEQDLRAGAPPYKVVRYHWTVIYSEMGSTESLFARLRSLRDAGCGNFRYMGENPPFREVPLSLTPTAVNGITWDEGTFRVSGEDSYLVFSVPEPTLVAGVRVTYIHSGEAGGKYADTNPAFRLFWKRRDQNTFPPFQSYSNTWLGTGPEEQTETIWVDETIDQLRIHPDDKPCNFKIVNIVLIVPSEE